MKFGYLRENDDYKFVIPEGKLKEFEGALGLIETCEEESGDWRDACSDFDNEFADFRIEGELYDMKILMEE